VSQELKSAFDLLGGPVRNPAEIRDLMDELRSLTVAVRKTMDRGLTPEESVPARALLRACQTAEETVQVLTAGA
jgi:hypothetical protein